MLQALSPSIKHSRTDVCVELLALGGDAPALDLIEWLAESR